MCFKDTFFKKATDYLENHPANRVDCLDDLIIFDRLLIGYSNAHDPLFETLKEPNIVAPHYLSPHTWLSEAETVISFFLSFSEKIRKSNRAGKSPSTEWLYGRIEGQEFINTFTQLMVEELKKKGVKAVAPSLHPDLNVIDLKSNWSERHTGYVSGLGTFSLSESIITEYGSAGRLTSIITSLKQPPTPRAYTGIHDYCLWYTENKCGACMKKCPPQAILKDGTKNKILCSDHLDFIEEKYYPRYGCGKCQAGMICEHKNPIR